MPDERFRRLSLRQRRMVLEELNDLLEQMANAVPSK